MLSRLIALLACALACTPAAALLIVGEVGHIQDGDSFFVIEGGALRHEIRIGAIDSPEKGQPYSRMARDNLRRLLTGHLLMIDAYQRDRYGRWVAKVSVDGIDAGLAQIRAGLAWHETRYAAEQRPADRRAYAAAQASARSERAGLWRQSRPTPPWQWRRSHPRRAHFSNEAAPATRTHKNHVRAGNGRPTRALVGSQSLVSIASNLSIRRPDVT